MLSLHVSPGFDRIRRFFAESDHTAWGVLAFAIISGALIFAALLSN